jgi:hypothetical protein
LTPELDLISVLFAFIVLQLDSHPVTRNKQKPIGDAFPNAHSLEKHVRAKATFALVRHVKNEQSIPKPGLVEPLFTVHLQASFIVRDGLSGLFS